jgi:succinyl-CoA synthetase beta subunit
MNIHEYQAKQLLARYGVAVPKGFVAYTAEEAEKAAQQLPGPVWVVKAQIHAGGRGTIRTARAACASSSRSPTSGRTPPRCSARCS